MIEVLAVFLALALTAGFGIGGAALIYYLSERRRLKNFPTSGTLTRLSDTGRELLIKQQNDSHIASDLKSIFGLNIYEYANLSYWHSGYDDNGIRYFALDTFVTNSKGELSPYTLIYDYHLDTILRKYRKFPKWRNYYWIHQNDMFNYDVPYLPNEIDVPVEKRKKLYGDEGAYRQTIIKNPDLYVSYVAMYLRYKTTASTNIDLDYVGYLARLHREAQEKETGARYNLIPLLAAIFYNHDELEWFREILAADIYLNAKTSMRDSNRESDFISIAHYLERAWQATNSDMPVCEIDEVLPHAEKKIHDIVTRLEFNASSTELENLISTADDFIDGTSKSLDARQRHIASILGRKTKENTVGIYETGDIDKSSDIMRNTAKELIDRLQLHLPCDTVDIASSIGQKQYRYTRLEEKAK